MTDLASLSDERIVALTLWGEIRGGSLAQQINVANVIANRVRADIHGDGKPDWWGEGWRGVCLAKYQFSCWNEGGEQSQRAKMLAVPETDRAYLTCLGVARNVMRGALADTTGGSTHYFANGTPVPSWANAFPKTTNDGLHTFYRDPSAKFPEDRLQAARVPDVAPSAPTPAPNPWLALWNFIVSLFRRKS